MEHLHSLENLSLTAAWVTIGSFDGVHRGHQALARQLAEAAHTQGQPAVVVTFYPHPAIVLHHRHAPYYLTSPEERAALLGEQGIDYVITLLFDRELANLSAEAFMHRLRADLDLRHLWVGYNFALGSGRQGNTEILETLGGQMGYTLRVITPVKNHAQAISSHQIRQSLTKGDVHQAARLLGRWYSVEGAVQSGVGRGRRLGIPTINTEVWRERLMPAAGVYATRVQVGDRLLQGVTNFGTRPTFHDETPAPQLETHLLDFNGDLYGATLRIEFIEYLRPERRFESVRELTEQIQRDILLAREVLSHANPTPDIPA